MERMKKCEIYIKGKRKIAKKRDVLLMRHRNKNKKRERVRESR